MKMYQAGIYCPYEGGCSALGIFSTREAAEKAAPWITENAAYFRDVRHQVFHVDEIEVNDTSSFTAHLNQTVDYIDYLRDAYDGEEGEDGPESESYFKLSDEDRTILQKLKEYQNAGL